MLGLSQDKGIVGLDIGSHSVKAIEVVSKKKRDRDVYEVARIGYELLPHDAIVEGTIIKLKNRNVAISISGNSVIIKKISLPAMEKEELAESIVWEAKHNIPYPYEETNVDYAILRPPRGTEEKNLDILLVAAKKDKIANYSNVVNQARKNLTAIDVDVFALQNALEINYPEAFESKIVAVVNIGANITNIAIIERGTSQLFRDLSLGGFFFIENMRKELNLSFDDAEKLLKGIPIKNGGTEKTDEVIKFNVKDLLDEVDKTFSFYEAGEKREKKIEQIYLSGGLALLKNIAADFEQKFNIKTEIFNPFRSVYYDEKKLDPAYCQEMAALFGVAVGLATRKTEK
jgi:type IV pilus assembly protein PilM